MARQLRSEFLESLLEQLAPLGTIRAKSMFGAHGLYCDDYFFAIVSDDIFYVKADAGSIPEFVAEGLSPFTYAMKDGRIQALAYYPLPDWTLDEAHELRLWAKKGLAAALRARNMSKSSKKTAKNQA